MLRSSQSWISEAERFVFAGEGHGRAWGSFHKEGDILAMFWRKDVATWQERLEGRASQAGGPAWEEVGKQDPVCVSGSQAKASLSQLTFEWVFEYSNPRVKQRWVPDLSGVIKKKSISLECSGNKKPIKTPGVCHWAYKNQILLRPYLLSSGSFSSLIVFNWKKWPWVKRLWERGSHLKWAP